MNSTIEMAGPWITQHEETILLDAIRSGWYGKNAYYYCELFEHEFSKYHDRKFALMTPNCTSAIHLLLTGLGIQDNDEIIVPDSTWIASAAPITYLRAKPIFVDISPINWCLDPVAVEKAITKRTKAIIAVNLYGNMANMHALQAISKKYDIPLIEDAAESLGSEYHGIKSGKFGIGSVFSFHRTKTITTGEGGMLLLDDEKLFDRCKFLRDHGRKPGSYFNTEVTYKYMPSNIQAALGYAQFQRLPQLIARKRWIWHTYQELLAGIPDIQLNPEEKNTINGVWCVALVFGKSHKLEQSHIMKRLSERNLPTRPFFFPLSSLPAFGSQAKVFKHRNPNAYDISNRGINLPSALNIDLKSIKIISDAINEIVYEDSLLKL